MSVINLQACRGLIYKWREGRKRIRDQKKNWKDFVNVFPGVFNIQISYEK